MLRQIDMIVIDCMYCKYALHFCQPEVKPSPPRTRQHEDRLSSRSNSRDCPPLLRDSEQQDEPEKRLLVCKSEADLTDYFQIYFVY